MGVIKPPARIADKAIACYGGDVSRLLDVVRARLVFGSAAALGRCLRLVAAADGAAAIVRVKNSLRAGQSSWACAGFRVRQPPGPSPPPLLRRRRRPHTCSAEAGMILL